MEVNAFTMIKRFLLIVFFINAFTSIFYFNSYSQHWNNLFLLPSTDLKYNDYIVNINNDNPIIEKFPMNCLSYFGANLMSDEWGKLKFYTRQCGIYNAQHQKVDSNFSGSWRPSHTVILPSGIENDKYYIYTTLDSGLFQYTLSVVNDSVKILSARNVFQGKLMNSPICISKHPSTDAYWLCFYYNDTIFSTKVHDDSFQFVAKTRVNSLGCGSLRNDGFVSSTDGKLILHTFLCNDYPYFMYIYLYNFDIYTGKITDITYIDYSKSGISPAVFSPDNKLIYYRDYDSINDKHPLIQLDISKKLFSQSILMEQITLHNLKLMNDGKIYGVVMESTRITHFPSVRIVEFLLLEINEPDSIGKKCDIQTYRIFKDTVYGSDYWQPFIPPTTPYENLRLRIRYSHKCDLSTNFAAIRDTSMYEKITWYFSDKDSISGEEIFYNNFPASGKYNIRIRGETAKGYIRYHSDTIVFIKPPTANFTTDTTIGCQWLKFKFFDASVRDTINATVGENWLWHFGDGGTSTQQNPEHIYTKTGKYKVKLIYSNGFCSDTIEKEQAVEIIEAPRPGFKMSQTHYCSPYTLQITDTSLGRVQTWHYDFGDGKNDSTASPSHRYPYAGTYKIVQTLTGPTGCVTKDSALLHLRSGFEGTEEINSLTTVVVDNSSILLNWQKHEDAFSYDLFRSPNDTTYLKLLNLTDSFHLDDKLIRDDQVYAYKIAGIDSCSRPSAFSRKLKNIVLNGEAHKSEYSILRWTPFELWQHGVKEYVLEYANPDGEFLPLLSTASREVRDDDFFTGDRQYEKCYRVVAIEQQGNQQQSISNTLCLPYEATFFVPTAFTPNGDGLNDTFFVRGISVENIHVRIYNRWGQLIFETTDLYKGWDGSYKGKACPIGAYSCLVTGKRKGGKFINTSFTISLLR